MATRRTYDTATNLGFGTPFLWAEIYYPTQPVSATTHLGQFSIPVEFEKVTGKSGIISSVQIDIAALGTSATSGNNVYKLVKVDASGNIIGSAVATLTVPYNANTITPVSVAGSNGKGFSVLPGENYRLDFVSGATGLATQPTNITVRVYGAAINNQNG